MSVFAFTSLQYAILLRRELGLRNQQFAKANRLPHSLSYGEEPAVLYEPYADGALHGNFFPAAYQAILKNGEWKRRLHKHHAQARKSLPPSDRGGWSELDSSNSSDALLMNIFCSPGVLAEGPVPLLLGIEDGCIPEFGHRARVPLASGNVDRTEIDMRLGDLLLEAKLTEGDFQCKYKEYVDRYRDLDEVFDRELLPLRNGRHPGYQLIRNVLAAHALGCSFCVLIDQRRPDLKEIWYSILRAIKSPLLRVRCKMLTWQEAAEALPEGLREFLSQKYGIVREQDEKEILLSDGFME